jgi:hypothetical protein
MYIRSNLVYVFRKVLPVYQSEIKLPSTHSARLKTTRGASNRRVPINAALDDEMKYNTIGTNRMAPDTSEDILTLASEGS